MTSWILILCIHGGGYSSSNFLLNLGHYQTKEKCESVGKQFDVDGSFLQEKKSHFCLEEKK